MYPEHIIWRVEQELEQMELYLNYIDQSTNNYIEKLEKEYSIEQLERLVEVDGDSPEMIRYNKYLDIFGSMFGDFPRRHFTSFIIIWTSFIEETFLLLCIYFDLIDEKMDMYNFKIKTAESLLRKRKILINIDHWQELNSIIRVRNRIVHHGGSYPIYENKIPGHRFVGPIKSTDESEIYLDNRDLDESLLKYLQHFELLRIFGKAFIFPKIDYCYHLVDFANEMLNDMLSKAKLV